MKALKYSLLSTLLISSASFATEAPTEQVVLPSIVEVISFCSTDKSCNSITPIIDEKSLNYNVKYQRKSAILDTLNNISLSTDPASGDDD